jgi:hypothetical protein
MTARRVAPAALALAAAGMVVAGLVVALWPLHANGVSGNALAPKHHPFDVGVYSYRPLPEHVTIGALRGLGVHVPQDDIDRRRRIAAALVAAGLVTAGAAGVTATVRVGRRAATGSPAG